MPCRGPAESPLPGHIAWPVIGKGAYATESVNKKQRIA
jgi:hypothetical protein